MLTTFNQITTNKCNHQRLITRLNALTASMNLKLKPSKCSSLSSSVQPNLSLSLFPTHLSQHCLTKHTNILVPLLVTTLLPQLALISSTTNSLLLNHTSTPVERKKALTLGRRYEKIQAAQLGIEPRSLVLRTSALTTELSRHSCEPC